MPHPPVIAVVEDDAAMREALAELLEVTDFSCRTFERAEAFLEAYEPERFDCLITDLHLPGISGLELLPRLRALGSALPVIVITSALDAQHRARAMQEGAFAYLTKPFSDKMLLGHVTEAIGRSVRQS